MIFCNSEQKRQDSHKKFIQGTCSLHNGYQLDYLSIDPTQSFVFKCMICITDEDVKQHSHIPIQQILTANEKTVFANFPFSDRKLTNDIKQSFQSAQTGEELQQQIETYFNDLRNNILNKIETIQAKMVKKAQDITNLSGKIMKLYDKMSEKAKLQRILVDSNKSLKDKSAEIKSLFSRDMRKVEDDEEEMKNALENVSKYKIIDFDSLQQIQDSILNKLEQINFFHVKDMKALPVKLPDSKPPKYQNLQFLPAPRSTFANLEVLNKEQTKAISGLIDLLANSRPYSDSEIEIKQALYPDQIINILRNPMNCCSQEYIDDISKVLKNLADVFALFRIRTNHFLSKYVFALHELEPFQITNLLKLAFQMNQLNFYHGDHYLTCKKPNENIQINSLKVREQLKNLDCNQPSIDQILVDYPIFELLPKINIIKFCPMIFIKSNYRQSQEMVISQKEGQVQLMIPDKKFGQSISEILDNERAYQLILKFNRPIGKKKSGEFRVGLIVDDWYDKKCLLFQERHNSGYFSKENNGATILIKGGRLSDQEIMNETIQLEFRWQIKSRQFFISDSTYSNINKVEEHFFDPNECYRFGIYFGQLAENDWIITISEKEIDLDSINKFE